VYCITENKENRQWQGSISILSRVGKELMSGQTAYLAFLVYS